VPEELELVVTKEDVEEVEVEIVDVGNGVELVVVDGVEDEVEEPLESAKYAAAPATAMTITRIAATTAVAMPFKDSGKCLELA